MNIVQAACPGCRNKLRIPYEWLSQEMRCKHCRQTFRPQAKSAPVKDKYVVAKPAPVAAPAAAVTASPPVAVAAPVAAAPMMVAPANGVQAQPVAVATNGDSFSFGAPVAANGQDITAPRMRRRGGNPWIKGVFLGLSVLVVAGLVIYLYRDDINRLIGGKEANPGNQIVQNGENNGNGGEQTPNNGYNGSNTDGGRENPNPAAPVNPKSPNPAPKEKPFDGREYFPRRALLINVNNYLFANRVDYGHKRVGVSFPGSSTSVLRDQLTRAPMNFPGTQIIELSDSAAQSHPTLKSVIETTIVDFLASCRKQDRILLLFAGHAIDGEEDNAYLVPLEGDLEDPETLISMKWLYEQLAKCQAQQKVLLLDVCRFPTGRGFELPPRDPLGAAMNKFAKNPPNGVQVWMGCKQDQFSVEYESGSLFIEALCAAMQDRNFRQSGIQEKIDAIPVDRMFPLVNQYMAKLWPSKDQPELQQVSELFGKMPATNLYVAAQPLPDQVALKMPKLKGGSAGKAMLDNILHEISLIPSTRAGRRSSSKLLEFSYLPPFPASALKNYQRDYGSIEELKKMVELKPGQFGLRKNVLEVIGILNENLKFTMKEKLYNPAGGPVDNKIKAAFKEDQTAPGLVLFSLEEEALPILDEAKEMYYDKELSLRWKAMYDYTRARLLSRLVYVYEYSYMLGKVQSDLPELTQGVHTGWVIGSSRRVTISKKEQKVRGWEREIKDIWRSIKKDYAGTPWAMFAKRESSIALGLEWRPSRN